MYDWGKPQFFGVRTMAANLSGGTEGSYTEDMFREDYPQFFSKADVEGDRTPLLPAGILDQLIGEANQTITEDRWGPGWRMAAGLYVAHYATLYLRTYRDGSDNPGQAADSGALVGVVKSAKLGDSEVSYDTSALTGATANWGDWNATQYGQMLATRARLAGLGGTYVI